MYSLKKCTKHKRKQGIDTENLKKEKRKLKRWEGRIWKCCWGYKWMKNSCHQHFHKPAPLPINLPLKSKLQRHCAYTKEWEGRLVRTLPAMIFFTKLVSLALVVICGLVDLKALHTFFWISALLLLWNQCTTTKLLCVRLVIVTSVSLLLSPMLLLLLLL